MYQEHEPVLPEVHAANPTGEEGDSADSTTVFELVAGYRRLDWIGPLAFKTRYAREGGVDSDLGTFWGLRGDQRLYQHRANLNSSRGLVYAYDLTWDEYAVLATDVPIAAVEVLLDHAMAIDPRMSAEMFAGLLAYQHPNLTPDAGTSTELTGGVEL